jgi:hypothetical protein
VVKVRERWRGPEKLLSRAPAEAPEKKPTPAQATGLTLVQIACIKRAYEQAVASPRPDKWKRCFVTAKVASCGLPALDNPARVEKALDEAIGPADWIAYLTDPKGMTCRAQGGQTPEACCEEAPPPKEKPKGDKAAPGR